MKQFSRSFFMENPPKEKNGIYYFGNENDGDCFDQTDFNNWRNTVFNSNWRTKRFLTNSTSLYLLKQIIDNHEHVIDLACGPGMGFIPSIKQLNPIFPCLVSDANSSVLTEWKSYLENNEIYSNLAFAQFSAFNIPIKSNTVQAYSSFIGISSTRNGENGYATALSEIHRTLGENGLFYTIENEWADISAILSVFEKINQRPWSCFCEKQVSWHDRFVQNGFEIVFEEPFEYRSLSADDNELGAASAELGIDVGINSTAYIVKNRY